jgi:uncharacterized UPF0160 family protein
MYTIVTHNGRFHSDDVLAVASLQLLLGKENTKIIRTRDADVLASADYVLDVGGIYDHELKRYDHHQPGAPVRENGIPYSSLGLIWKHYGSDICDSPEVAEMLEQSLCQPVDAGDNGVSLYVKNEYGVSPFELYNVISSYAPAAVDPDYDAGFVEAVDFARALLERLISGAKFQSTMLEYVKEVYEKSEDKSLLVFNRSVPKNLLVAYPEVKAVVYPSIDKGVQTWRASMVPKSFENPFINRVNFPKNWAGLVNEELAKVSGISDAVFCHKTLYLFCAHSIESTIKAAKMAK